MLGLFLTLGLNVRLAGFIEAVNSLFFASVLQPLGTLQTNTILGVP